MTIGVGGSTAREELAKLKPLCDHLGPISLEEYQARIQRAGELMAEHQLDAIYLNAGTNLSYFTGTHWGASERLVGALLSRSGELRYIAPFFEQGTLHQYMQVSAPVAPWQEHESPYQLVVDQLAEMGISEGRIGIDEATPFFISNGINELTDSLTLCAAKPVTAGCRAQKSACEIELMKAAMQATLVVQQAAARILRPGISTQEVTEFIDAAHRIVGAKNGSYFCIVLFGEDSAFPHGVANPKPLAEGDMVLIDTGFRLHGYHSDITRSYVFGEPTERQRELWQVEKDAQAAGFAAAQLGTPCGEVDVAARACLASHGFGPDYQTPGCPHRTGHGIGLDIHEWPYLVRSDRTPLSPGHCFSNEPMLVVPGEFGIRLEDHFYMTEQGPAWFTEPSHSIDEPFAGVNA